MHITLPPDTPGVLWAWVQLLVMALAALLLIGFVLAFVGIVLYALVMQSYWWVRLHILRRLLPRL